MNTYTYPISRSNLSDYKTALWKLRRERQIRTRIFAALVSLVIILVIALAYTTFSSNAEDSSKVHMNKYYTWVNVESGDTLTDIANEYFCETEYKSFNNYINEICKINHINSIDNIEAGKDLCIPYFSEEIK